MRYDEIQGIIPENVEWVPTILHILRRRAILDIIQTLTPGNIIEMGCGSGTILYEFYRRNFKCKGVDISEEAIKVAKKIFGDKMDFVTVSSMGEEDIGKYDYLMAIEVLEHNEDDSKVLQEWRELLSHDGKLIVSVPAHPELWGDSDVWAGHFRRYTRDSLIRIISDAGFTIEKVVSYGYPLANWLHPIRQLLNSLKMRKKGAILSKEESTQLSGINRKLEHFLYPLYSNTIMSKLINRFNMLQRKYYNSAKGVGYLVLAKRNT